MIPGLKCKRGQVGSMRLGGPGGGGTSTAGLDPQFGKPRMCLASSESDTDAAPCRADSQVQWSTAPRRATRETANPPNLPEMFGTGISWDLTSGRRHAVGRHLDLIDERGQDVSSWVDPGDVVTHVDDMEVEKLSRATVEKMLAGARNSTATVCMYSIRRQQEVVFELRRHVPSVPRTSPSAQSVERGPPAMNGAAPAKQEQKQEPVTEFEAAGRMPVLTKKGRESLAGIFCARSVTTVLECVSVMRTRFPKSTGGLLEDSSQREVCALPCRCAAVGVDEDASSR